MLRDPKLEYQIVEHSNGELVEILETPGKYDQADLTIKRSGKIVRIEKHLTFFDQHVRHACDAQCGKAWGVNSRPRVVLDPKNDDDYFFYADHELGDAPADPGSYEGGHGKPEQVTGPESINKWCVRECERSAMSDRGKWAEPIAVPDFSHRLYNIKSSQGKEPA